MPSHWNREVNGGVVEVILLSDGKEGATEIPRKFCILSTFLAVRIHHQIDLTIHVRKPYVLIVYIRLMALY